MSALDELLKDIPQDYDEVDVANHLLHWREQSAAELLDLRAELATAKARAKTAEENWHKNEARIGKLESQLSWWLETYDITMPCGHKNRYLLTDGRGDIVGDVNGNCVCVMCRLENAAEIEAELKGM